jgi:hypothetical protein
VPFNGSGTFTRLYSWVVDAANSVDISSTRTDAEMNGFAAGLSNCITRDGQSPPSADIPFGGKKLTNLGAATVGSDALNRDTADTRYLLATGATNLTLSGALTAATLSISAGAGISGTTSVQTLNASDDVTLTTAALSIATNNRKINLTDTGGSHPYIICDGSNSLGLFGTDSSGAARTIFTAAMRSSSSPLVFAIATQGLTPSPGDNSTNFATTAFTATALASYAPLASPALTGTPTAPTPSAADSSTKIATTAFVAGAKAPNVQPVTSAATVTPTFSNDLVDITAQAAGLTLANPTGTAVNGWGIVVRIKDNGSPQTIAYGTQYAAIGLAKPTTTVAGKVLNIGMIYNANLTRWEIVSVAQE